MRYYSIAPQLDLEITQIYTIHYFENYKDDFFPGERHDFWELVYIDRGELIIQADSFPEGIRLNQGSLVIHRPNEFHSFYANNISANNIVVLSFDSPSSSLSYFKFHPLHQIGTEGKNILHRILNEARLSFSTDLADSMAPRLQRSSSPPFAGEQMIKLLLELLLISLIRQESVSQAKTTATSPGDSPDDSHSKRYAEEAIRFLKENLTVKISLSDVCEHVHISRAHLQKVFRKQTGKSVMRYLVELRIDEAKFLIRNRTMDFTQISEKLCYNSIHHFSRQFREVTGMSPTEYAKSIQSIASHSSSHPWDI